MYMRVVHTATLMIPTIKNPNTSCSKWIIMHFLLSCEQQSDMKLLEQRKSVFDKSKMNEFKAFIDSSLGPAVASVHLVRMC